MVTDERPRNFSKFCSFYIFNSLRTTCSMIWNALQVENVVTESMLCKSNEKWLTKCIQTVDIVSSTLWVLCVWSPMFPSQSPRWDEWRGCVFDVALMTIWTRPYTHSSKNTHLCITLSANKKSTFILQITPNVIYTTKCRKNTNSQALSRSIIFFSRAVIVQLCFCMCVCLCVCAPASHILINVSYQWAESDPR